MTVARLIQTRRELVHDRGQTGGVIADRLVDEEKAARSALRHQPAHVVEARDETRALGPDPLRRKTLRTPGVWVRAVERSHLPRPRRELRDGRVAAVLE